MGIFESALLQINSLVEGIVSNFNLRRDDKANNIDFDNDEVTATDVEQGKLNFMCKIVDKIVEGKANSEQIKIFNNYRQHYKKPFYKVWGSQNLKKLVVQCCKYFGNQCDLNWIDVS